MSKELLEKLSMKQLKRIIMNILNYVGSYEVDNNKRRQINKIIDDREIIYMLNKNKKNELINKIIEVKECLRNNSYNSVPTNGLTNRWN